MLDFLGKKWKRQLLRSLFPDPLPEGHPVDRDSLFCLTVVRWNSRPVIFGVDCLSVVGRSKKLHAPKYYKSKSLRIIVGI